MKVFRAHLEEVFREAAARWTLLAYFALTTLFIILFAATVNLDVVNGALAGARLFGNDVQMDRHPVMINKFVAGVDMGISGMLFMFGTVLGLLATAHLMPRMLEKGTVDLFLSRPAARVRVLLIRYLSGLILIGANLVYLFGAYQLIMFSKTGVIRGELWLAAGTIFFSLAVLIAFQFLIGVLSGSSTVSLMAGFAVFVFGLILQFHKEISAALSSAWAAGLIDAIYWVLPKTGEMLRGTVIQVAAGQLGPGGPPAPDYFVTFSTTAIFGFVCLALSAWLFHRRDF